MWRESKSRFFVWRFNSAYFFGFSSLILKVEPHLWTSLIIFFLPQYQEFLSLPFKFYVCVEKRFYFSSHTEWLQFCLVIEILNEFIAQTISCMNAKLITYQLKLYVSATTLYKNCENIKERKVHINSFSLYFYFKWLKKFFFSSFFNSSVASEKGELFKHTHTLFDCRWSCIKKKWKQVASSKPIIDVLLLDKVYWRLGNMINNTSANNNNNIRVMQQL